MSSIVNKFYSFPEKLGFKKHKVSQKEINYLNSLPKMEQFEEFSSESDFNIERLRIKMNIFLLFSIMFVLLTVFLIASQVYTPIVVSVILTLTFLIFTKRYKTKMEILSFSKYILEDIKKSSIEKSFR